MLHGFGTQTAGHAMDDADAMLNAEMMDENDSMIAINVPELK